MKRSGQPGLQPAEIEAEWAHAPPGREAAFRNELMRALHQLLSEQYGRDRPPLVHRSRRPLPSASKRAKPVAREVARGPGSVRRRYGGTAAKYAARANSLNYIMSVIDMIAACSTRKFCARAAT